MFRLPQLTKNSPPKNKIKKTRMSLPNLKVVDDEKRGISASQVVSMNLSDEEGEERQNGHIHFVTEPNEYIPYSNQQFTN